MLSLHANVYALPATAKAGPTRTLRGLELATLSGASGGGPPAFLDVLPVTFEAMQQRLVELPRCDCEPDGFFLMTGHTEEGGFWRLNGHMQEFQPEGADEPRMHRLELNGECPEGCLDMVLRTTGWPEVDLAFELVRDGVTLPEEAFREWARGGRVPGAAAVGDDAALTDSNASRTASRVVSTATSNQADQSFTTWHITFGTYGARLHGDRRPTVDRERNQIGEPFEPADEQRRAENEASLSGDPVRLSSDQRLLIERVLPSICQRGGWRLRAAAAQPDHVHVVCDVRSDIHGEKVRRLMKRWLTETLNHEWPDATRPRWWAVQGSNKAIHDEAYLQNAVAYVERQRTTT